MTATKAKKLRQAARRATELEAILRRGHVRVLRYGLRVEQTPDERRTAVAVLRRRR